MHSEHMKSSLAKMKILQKDLTMVNMGLVSAGPPPSMTDYFLLACSKRVYSLTQAETVLLQEQNYTTAAALVRLTLDTALRIYAIDVSPDRDATAGRVMEGERIDHMKGRQGRPLPDRALRDGVSQFYPWVAGKYDLYCGWVHFGQNHLKSLASSTSVPGWLYLNPTAQDAHITNEEYESVASDFVQAATLVLQLLQRWSRERKLFD